MSDPDLSALVARTRATLTRIGIAHESLTDDEVAEGVAGLQWVADLPPGFAARVVPNSPAKRLTAALLEHAVRHGKALRFDEDRSHLN